MVQQFDGVIGEGVFEYSNAYPLDINVCCRPPSTLYIVKVVLYLESVVR